MRFLRRNTVGLSTFVASIILMSAVSAAPAQSLPSPDNKYVYLSGIALRDVSSRLVGDGVTAFGLSKETRRAHDTTGNEIVWREIGRETDPQGGRHIYYRQYLLGDGLGAELYGSEMAVHVLPSGQVSSVIGRQFESVRLAGTPALSTAEAVEYAFDGLPGRRVRIMSDQERAARAAETTLKLVQIDGVFRPAYFTSADDADGESQLVVVDAQNERILAVQLASDSSNCTPTLPQQFRTAVGKPVRSGVANRALSANIAPDRPGGYTHEAVMTVTGPTTGALPIRLIVYDDEPIVSSYYCGGNSLTIIPVKANLAQDASGNPVYFDDGFFPGKAAADALFHTKWTMWTFDSMGRKGWDNKYSDARIYLDYATGDFASFPTSGSMANSLRIGTPQSFYNLASSLDLVAHEWGHGVITSRPGVGNFTSTELREGFADVIGMMVEKRRQPLGSGLETSSDWTMHEDSGDSKYARGVVDDYDTGHVWVGPNGSVTLNDRLHKHDGTSTNEPHATGNLLNVVHKLMAAGGVNPICARAANTNFNCGPSITGMGSSKAGSLLFHAVQFTAGAAETWETLANAVNESAFLRFNTCSAGPIYNAKTEQDIVAAAFAAIGYPRTVAEQQCP